MSEEIELLRKEWGGESGGELEVISCKVGDDGSLEISGYDLGPSVERFWGDSDYEYGIKLSPGDTRRLLPHLLKLVMNGTEPTTVGDLRKLCEANGIDSGFWSWV